VWELRPPGSNLRRHIEKLEEIPRSRYLGCTELEKLGEAMRAMVASDEVSPSAANAIRLLLLTGARLNEILTER
jgi:hypothetical protein